MVDVGLSEPFLQPQLQPQPVVHTSQPDDLGGPEVPPVQPAAKLEDPHTFSGFL